MSKELFHRDIDAQVSKLMDKLEECWNDPDTGISIDITIDVAYMWLRRFIEEMVETPLSYQDDDFCLNCGRIHSEDCCVDPKVIPNAYWHNPPCRNCGEIMSKRCCDNQRSLSKHLKRVSEIEERSIAQQNEVE